MLHRYPSSLSDSQWAAIEPHLPAPRPGGRPRSVNLRSIMDAIFYVLKTGCQWRQLPREFGPWSTVPPVVPRRHLAAASRYPARRGASPAWPAQEPARHDRRFAHGQDGRKRGPRGYDCAKKMTGHKCHVLVDTLGFLHGIHVTPATVQDRDGANELLSEGMSVERAPARIYADGEYGGELETWVLENTSTRLRIVPRHPESKGSRSYRSVGSWNGRSPVPRASAASGWTTTDR